MPTDTDTETAARPPALAPVPGSPDPLTTAALAPVPYAPLLDGVLVAVLAHTPGAPDSEPAEADWTLAELPDGLRVLEVATGGAPAEIRFSVPLGDAAGYWHPQGGWRRTLLADWEGRATVSLVDGLAAGCLYDYSGATLLTFAAADPAPETTLRFGVSEENDTHVVHLRLPADAEGRPHRVVLVPSAPSVAAALRPLRAWYARELPPMPVPEGARTPVYSTWYAFNQDVSAEEVETQAALAAQLGCGALILDDGWQEYGHGRGYAGLGDWRPDPAKFPDFTGHVAEVRALGLRYLAWTAPLLIGPDADCHARWAPYAPAPATVPGAHVLDPRLPEVRRHVVELCARLVRDHGLDGLKLDFLDQAMVYAGDGAGGIGRAMAGLLAELRAALEDVRPEGLLLELRQPYTGPGTAPFGNMLRSFDCPADAAANRVRTLDTALLAVGGAVHSDMLLWSPSAPVEAVARQLIGALHAVPQLSVRLDRIPEAHRAAIAFWLSQWRANRGALLDGEVEPGRPDELYPLVRATAGDRCLISVHGSLVVPLDLAAHRRVELVNGSARDTLTLAVRGGPAEVARVIHGPDGRIIESTSARFGEGPHTLAVPRGGLASLSITEGRR
ncbi:glycoside hydrolase family 36 protein [Streptomyces sp. G-G2]|uniref:glycoside hydrolase family 36 protein n=1 Tax=Streptomyces sp. G-G2 TaxID=3046201 RepID=UPI0024BAB228|nr:glycoside hydrolase family 36 protein [Streptomyces sp. G-G2]MDJ0384879.1 alpha-galactosidase [Streptomyces sp. G-G2]